MKRQSAVLLLLFQVLLLPATALARPMVNAAHLVTDSQKATLELTLNAAPDFHVFYLANPYRVVIDMEALDWRAAAPGKMTAKALVTGLRYGVQGSGASRLVLDLVAPARISDAHYRRDKSGATHLDISLQQVSAANFAAAMNQYRAPQKATEDIAEMSTAAGGQAGTKASRRNSTEQAATQTTSASQLQASATSQGAAAHQGTTVGTTSKEVYVPPLLTDADTALRSNASTTQGDPLLYQSPDGYSLSYMHPPGSFFGAGVTVGMQF
ncbi:MAG TPA: AMIN domain-containing protein [Terriglobales bacterium]|nr:AMIN domain-containing protein [Terriglobales bacterium]